MIIALSGEIGSGKDLVAKIIQSITSSDRLDKVEEIVLNNWIDPHTPWEVRKFADKLKDIVCIMIGCTRDQLEDREFKEKELGEEWWYYVNSFGAYVPYVGHRIGNTSNLVKPTPRLFMQLLGTECGRNIIHPNCWVNSLMTEYKSDTVYSYEVELLDLGMSEEQRFKVKSNPKTDKGKYPNWIISDMRFPNELAAVKRNDGITIRIERPTFYYKHKVTGEIERTHSGLCDGDVYVPVPTNEIAEHASETGLDNAEFDYVIHNNGSISDLIKSVYEILIKTGIINER